MENSREDQETKKSTSIVKGNFLLEEIFLKNKKNKIDDVTYFGFK